jgi:hypothetical protein
VRQEGTGEADVQLAIAQRVKHCQFAGKLERVVERGQHCAGDQARPLRHLCRGGSKEHTGFGL